MQTPEEYAEALDTMAEIIMDCGKCGRLEAKITMERAAKFIRSLAQQPLSVQEHIGQLHEWNLQTGRCTECSCHYVGFERKDPCPGSAPTVGGEQG